MDAEQNPRGRGRGRRARGRGRGRGRGVYAAQQNPLPAQAAPPSAASLAPEVDVQGPPVQEAVQMPTQAQMQGLMNILTMMGQAAQAQAQAVQPTPTQPPEVPQSERLERMMKMATRLKVPDFGGDEEPNEIVDWLSKIEMVFEMTTHEPEDQVAFARLMMKSGVQAWWKMILEEQEDDFAPSWDFFKEKFQNQYIPRVLRRQLHLEFLALQQGELTVKQYKAEFERLEVFGKASIATPEERARRFFDGLHPDLTPLLGHVTEDDSYPTVVSAAMRAEAALAGSAAYHEKQVGKREAPSAPQGGQKKKQNVGLPPPQNKQQRQGNEAVQASKVTSESSGNTGRNKPNCKTCGRYHRGECWRKYPRRCFECGEEGHIARDCQNQKQDSTIASDARGGGQHLAIPEASQQTRTPQPARTARAFTVTPAAAPASTDVIPGKISKFRGRNFLRGEELSRPRPDRTD